MNEGGNEGPPEKLVGRSEDDPPEDAAGRSGGAHEMSPEEPVDRDAQEGPPEEPEERNGGAQESPPEGPVDRAALEGPPEEPADKSEGAQEGPPEEPVDRDAQGGPPEKLEERNGGAQEAPLEEPAEAPQGTKWPEPVAEAPSEEEAQGAAMTLEEVELPSQAHIVPSKEGLQDPLERTKDEEHPASALQETLLVETVTSPGPLEMSEDAAAVGLPTEKEEAWISAQEDKSPIDITHKTSRRGEEWSHSRENILRIEHPEEKASERERESQRSSIASEGEEGRQEGRIGKASFRKTPERTQPPETEIRAQAAEKEHRSISRERIVRQESPEGSPKEMSLGSPASARDRDSPDSSVTRGHLATEDDEIARRSGEEAPSRESKEGAQEEEGLSKTITAASDTAPAEEQSVVSSALPGMMFEEKSKLLSTHPLSLTWVFGYNHNLPVFNLLDEEYRVILYVCSHTAVIHDIFRNKQYHLQGHSSCISCICISEDRRWIATADRGPESMVIIWDGYSAVPVHTIFDSHPEGGVGAIAISHDSKFLATIGAGEVQKVCVWRWTSPEPGPVCSVELQTQFGIQDYIAFSSRDHRELVSNSQTQVIFYMWEDKVLQYHPPLLSDKTFNKTVGNFSQSLFHFSTAQAITGTMEGKMVVWDAVPSKVAAFSVKPFNMKAIKLMHLQKDGITVLAITDRNFVTCDVKGHVKFYDGDLQLLHWYSQLKLGCIRSVSFSKKPMCPVDISKFPASCTLSGQPFVVRNFILSTSDALVVHVWTEGLKVTKCLEEPKDMVHAITCHPSKPLMAKGSHCGLLKVWNYKLNKYLVSRIFKGERIQSLCYNHDGSLLAAGFTNGSVYILDSISLENDCPEPFRESRAAIIHMSFSHQSQYLATAEENISVTLYKKSLVDEVAVWERLAALHSHYKPICALLFGVYLDSDEPRLLSLGEDRLLVEYDLEHCVKDKLAIIRRDRIEQSAVPRCVAWYPPLTTEYFFFTANDQYKMKMYNVTTKLCRKTVLGPTYGTPLEKMLVLPIEEGQDPQKRYLAYITKDKVGLQILPVDGNPHKSSAFNCHPAGVSNLACSYEGGHLFTSGASDFSVMKWDINLIALEAAAFLGGEDLIPFYNLLEGGREGEFFKELEDYFYYAQLCHQGIDTMEPRKVSTHIPLECVPSVMRAMGFYPTEEQIEDMLNEVKFSDYLETGKQVTKINLGDFIRLYINHRPAFGLSIKEIQNAFQVLGYENENRETSMNRDDLLLLLQHRGEHFTEEQLAECLTTLLGMNPEGGRSEVGTYDPTGAQDYIEEGIPEEITAAHFTVDILGLPVPEPPSREAETTNEPESSTLTSDS
ncbi:cilia- and flagella-associated protein 251 isoform X2 [Hemicordylus capensis]|nr:cilia- and flagella-associated protein 251 isoform X2 [Hemicordylus capensis]